MTIVLIGNLITPALAQAPTSFEQLKSDYFFQLEQYRIAKEEYDVDRAEFAKLGTLATREVALESLKEVMKARSLVLASYSAALENLLAQAQGIDVNDKQKVLDGLLSDRVRLKQLHSETDDLAGRDEINAASARFELEAGGFIDSQNRALILLAIGRVQNTFDQLIVATVDFEDRRLNNIELESLKQSAFRGMKDVTAANKRAEITLKAARSRYGLLDRVVSKSRDRVSTSETYKSVVEDLNSTYAAMNQSIVFLQELERTY